MAIVASGSRGGFLGFAVMLVVLAAFAVRKHPGLVLAGVVVVLCTLPVLPDSYWRRMASITDDSKDDVQSSQARRRLMGESWAAFVQNPLTGVGAGQFKDWNPQGRVEAWHEAHNVWLQVAAELGILGIGAFLFLVSAPSTLFQTRRRQQAGAAPRRAARTTSARCLHGGHGGLLAGWFAFFSLMATTGPSIPLDSPPRRGRSSETPPRRAKPRRAAGARPAGPGSRDAGPAGGAGLMRSPPTRTDAARRLDRTSAGAPAGAGY